jgi:hypothetical protein
MEQIAEKGEDLAPPASYCRCMEPKHWIVVSVVLVAMLAATIWFGFIYTYPIPGD